MTASMEVSPNYRYLTTGVIDIFPTSNTSNPLDFSVVYPQQLSGFSNVKIAFSLSSIKIFSPSGRLEFSPSISAFTSTYFTFSLSTTMPSSISNLSFRFLIIAGQYAPDNTNFRISQYPITGATTGTNISANNSGSIPVTLSPTFNTTGGVSTFVSIFGLDVSSNNPSSNYLFDIGLSVQVDSATQITLTIYSDSATSTLMRKVVVYVILINDGFFNRNNFAGFTVGSINSSAPLSYSNVGKVYDKSTLVGLHHFRMEGDTFLDIAVIFNGVDSFTATSQNQFNHFTIDYILMLTYFCPYSTPYSIPSQGVCTDQCPARTFVNGTNLQCDSCPYQCYTCDSSLGCLSCNAATDFRYLNSSNCLPMPGYYESFLTVSGSCSTGC